MNITFKDVTPDNSIAAAYYDELRKIGLSEKELLLIQRMVVGLITVPTGDTSWIDDIVDALSTYR